MSLLTVTGCASLLGTDYREEYAKRPEARPTAETMPAVTDAAVTKTQNEAAAAASVRTSLGRLEFSTEAVTETDELLETAEPLISQPDFVAEEAQVPEEAQVAEETRIDDGAPFAAFAAERDQFAQAERSDVPDQENPFAVMARQQNRQTSSEAPAVVKMASGTAGLASTFRAAEPRLPTAQAGCPPAACVTIAASPQAQAYPDEYIFDGGDRDTPVHYWGNEMEGLDSEDTVAEFKDHTGENHVIASNRVAVYAPRFGAVETTTGPGIDVKIDKAARSRDVSGPWALHDERGMDMNVARVPASGVAVRSGASGIETAQPAHMSEKTDAIIQSRRVDQGMEAKTMRGLSLIEVSEVHQLNLHILAPVESDIRTALGESASTSQATQTYATFRIQAMTGSEEGGRKGEIHITKEASPLVAKAGDVITFTIHFRNTGDYNVNEVRIIDNLTPRLLYIDGTGEIKLPGDGGGDLMVIPSHDGGQVLNFELDQPLKGGQSGTITFQATVL